MDKLKKALSGDDEEEEKGIVTQLSDATTLSWGTRIKGFIICFGLGIILSVLGTILLFLKDGLTLFAIFYTIGNVLSLVSTCFLMGPLNQLKKMFAKTRIIATLLVLIMIALTLVAALALHNPALAIVCCVIQFLALTWYSLSYIPFASNVCELDVRGISGIPVYSSIYSSGTYHSPFSVFRDMAKKCFASCIE